MKTRKITKNLTDIIMEYESNALDAWHQALGNTHIPTRDVLLQLGICADRITRLIHMRAFNKHVSTRNKIGVIISGLKKKSIIDEQMRTLLSGIIEVYNKRKHGNTQFQKNFVEINKLKLIEVIKWYQDFSGGALDDLKMVEYSNRMDGGFASTFLQLEPQIPKETMETMMSSEKLGTYESVKDEIEDEPIYSSLIIDESISMSSARDAVIESQNDAISAIRGSYHCGEGLLYLIQHKFNDSSVILNPLNKVDSSGDDNIVLLNKRRYKPIGNTALYDTIFENLTMLYHEATTLEKRGRRALIIIGVITDGEDTCSRKYTPDNIKVLVDDLTRRGMLYSSVIIGCNIGSRAEENLKRVQNAMGFSRYISIKGSSDKAIRDAFRLWSEFSLNANIKVG